MKSPKIWANLSANNLEKTQEFYEKLGFKLNGKPNKDLVSFTIGEDDFVIHFFAKDRLKDSLEGNISDLKMGNEIMFSLSAECKQEVNEWMEKIENAGGNIHFNPKNDKKKIYDDFGFYVLVFSDLDGHKFNVLYNPNS